MNILIVGGLLLVGIAALIAVVLLFMAENRDVKRRAVATNQEARLKQAAVQNSDSPVTEVTGTLGPAILSEHEDNILPALHNQEEMQARLNGQFHELVTEVHTLHQQVQSFEQRLSHIAGMLDSLEQSATQRVKVHEESETPDEV